MHDPGVAVFLFLAIGALSLFAFLSVATWTGTRQQERESYYKAEMMKKIAEVGGERNPALEYLREQERIAAAKRVIGFRLAGMINIGGGAGVDHLPACAGPLCGSLSGGADSVIRRHGATGVWVLDDSAGDTVASATLIHRSHRDG